MNLRSKLKNLGHSSVSETRTQKQIGARKKKPATTYPRCFDIIGQFLMIIAVQLMVVTSLEEVRHENTGERAANHAYQSALQVFKVFLFAVLCIIMYVLNYNTLLGVVTDVNRRLHE